MKNIFIIPTEKGTGAIAKTPKELLYIVNDHNRGISDHIDYDVYITSDEEIKEGDWCLLNNRLVVRYFKPPVESKSYQKIILTTDQDLIKDGVQAIDDEFLEWFVKNPSCEEVEIKSETLYEHRDTYRPYPSDCKNLTKTKINYFISTIPKEEPKQETPEKREPYWELIDKKADTNNTIDLNAYAMGVENGVKWQAERIYSEEDICEYVTFCIECDRAQLPILGIKSWFEQFKKKLNYE